MTALQERNHPAEFIISEANGHRSRETVTVVVPAGARFQSGQLLGVVTATGKYVEVDTADAGAGNNTVKGILYAEVDNTEGDEELEAQAIVICRDAEVVGDRLIGQATTEELAVAQLLTLGIVVRQSENGTYGT